MEQKTGFKAFWTIDNVLLVCVMVIMAALNFKSSISSDTWWLLRSGKDILATHTIALQDPYSYTATGNYWPNHEWLSEVMLYLIYVAGGFWGLKVWAAVMITATMLITLTNMRGRYGLRALILMTNLVLGLPFWHIRPQIITFLLFSIGLSLLNHPRRWLYYPILLLLWGNLHAGALVGGVIIIAAAIVALWRDRSQFWQWIGTGLACIVTLMLNPLGYGTAVYAVNSLGSGANRVVQEWAPVSLDSSKSILFLAVFMLFLVCVVYLRKKLSTHREWTFVVAGILTGLLAIRSIRHIPLFVLCGFPVISWAMADSLPSTPKVVRPAIRMMLQAILAIVLVGSIWLVAVRGSEKAPIGAANLAALGACSGHIYNNYDSGGPLLWFLPDTPVMVDNRLDPYPLELVVATNVAQYGKGYQELFARYDVQCALVPKDAPLLKQLSSAGWRQVSTDSSDTVLYRP